MASPQGASKAAQGSWQTVLSGHEHESPHTRSTSPCNGVEMHHFSELGSNFSYLSLSTLLSAAWALVVRRQVNLDHVKFAVASPPLSMSFEDKVENGSICMVPLQVNTTTRQTVEQYLATLRELIIEGQKPSSPVELSTLQTLLHIQPSNHVSAPLSPDQEPNGEHDYDDGWASQLPCSFSLVVEIRFEAEETIAVAKFDLNIFPRGLVSKLLDRFGLVALQLATINPQYQLTEINMVTPKDLCTIWERNGAVPPGVDRCVHDIFSGLVKSQPDLPAVCAWDGNLTYGELDGMANRLANKLAAMGVGEGVIVPVCFEKSMWVIVAVMAVLKAGGAFLLLDPVLPLERLRYMVHAIEAHLIVASQFTQGLSSQLVANMLIIEAGLFTQPDKQPHACLSPSNPSSLMYAVFTSGSTGLPKCVLMTHVNVASAFHHQAHLLGFNKDSRILDYSSYSFTTTISNFFGALAVGGCLCIPNEDDRQNKLAQAISSLRCNVIDITPSVMQTLSPEDLPAVQVIIFGGETIPSTELERWWGKVRLINLYGQSECTANATINNSPRTLHDVASIGHGAGLVTWVVEPDDHDKLAPVGCVGELMLEGPLVGRGYLNDAEKTSAVFIEDPLWLLQGASSLSRRSAHTPRHGRMYKTGDLVQYNEDGSLAFHGRKDTQVKIRGQRVELGEVEHMVQKWVGVKQVAAEVIIPQGEHSSPTLVTFLKTQDSVGTSGEPTISIAPVPKEMQDFLSKHLPAYMLPTALFWMSSLPTNASGKLDRKELRRIGATLSVEELAAKRTTNAPKTQPTSEEERLVQGAWAAILHVPTANIGLDDSFFHLGGDSVAAIELVTELRRVGIQLSVADILGFPVLRDLACRSSRIEQQTETQIASFALLGDKSHASTLLSDVSRQYHIDQAMIRDMYPCTPLQEGLISLSFKRLGSYIEQSVLEINPRMRIQDLCAAWEHVVSSVPVLRTYFVHTHIGFLQAVVDEPVHWVDAAGLDEYLASDRKSPMTLGSPLSRYALAKDGTGKCKWLVWTVHHAICDGWTANLIKEAVEVVLQGNRDLFRPGLPFQNFISYIGDQSGATSSKYWKDGLSAYEGSTFPSLPRSIELPLVDGLIRISIPQPRATWKNITTSTFIRAAWGLTIGRMTSSADVVFGVTVSGRDAPVAGIESMVAPTFATIPMRVKFDEAETVSNYLRRIQQQMIDMIPFEQMGLQTIARMSPSCAQACMFQSLLVIQPQIIDDAAQRATGTWKEVTQNQWLNSYALTLQIRLGKTTMQVDASCDSRVVEVLEVEKLLNRLKCVIMQLDTADNALTVGQIQVLTPPDLEQVWEWNSVVPTPAKQCVHHIIEEVTKAQPDALALDAWDGRLTYGELDAVAGKIGRHLAKVGVQPNALVPLCFEKSMWTSVAVLAVLKARAGFVLVEPFLPQHRLQAILQQIGSPIILSSPKSLLAVSPLAQKVIEVDARWLDATEPAPDDLMPEPPQSSSTVMFSVFTSGSTGVPKGVVMTHDNFSTGLKYQSEKLGFGPDARVFDFAAYSFDIAVHNVLATLCSGGCLCVPAEEDRWGNLNKALIDSKATVVDLTPSVARLLSPLTLSHLKTLILAGEAVNSDDATRWLGNVRVVNAYGPAECGISTISVGTSLRSADEVTSIGKGAGVVAWVVNPHNHNLLLPPGSIGELLLEGPLVGQGYLNDREKTAAAFIHDPPWLLRGTPRHPGRGGRLYKTGDLVRYDEDGKLQFFGRKDTQVKIRGQRIELAEVEHFVCNCVPEVRQVTAEIVVPHDENAQPTLVAFVEISKTMETNTETLDPAIVHIDIDARAQLAKHLPRHMRPTAYVFMPGGLPLSATGKVDRKRLREIGASFSIAELAQDPTQQARKSLKRQPESESERRMQEIWARVLKIDASSIGMDDDFFNLGGDSIAVMVVVAEARKVGLHLTAREMFRHPSLSISPTTDSKGKE
ncbi:acetyl-CoA synthetase-like protein [Xylariaceae sp. FL1019]|nr:acetyl-CoA synthetase-like protein [Xylariaceae sp. FL1019]